jgi:hypothetical protein
MSTEYMEELSGTVNGVNKVFTTSHTILTGFVLYLNGMVYPDVDTVFGFTITGTNEITLTTAPYTGDVLSCFYIGA